MDADTVVNILNHYRKKKQKYAECCVKQYLQETPSLHPCTMSVHVIDSHYIDTKTIEEIFFYTP
jgi:hypothetical protein